MTQEFNTLMKKASELEKKRPPTSGSGNIQQSIFSREI